MKQEDIDFYMDTAFRAAERSKAVRKKVGAVVVTNSGGMYIGYNGTPKGVDNCCEIMLNGELVTKPNVIHAEKNALGKMLKEGVSTHESVLFLTLSPCTSCATLIASAGVKRVVYAEEYRDNMGLFTLMECGVEVMKYER